MTEDDKALVERLRKDVNETDTWGRKKNWTEQRSERRKAADRIEAQAAEIKAILDREADTYRRHDAKVDALEAENERLREALGNLINAYIANVDTYRLGGFYTDPEIEDEVIEARAALGETK